MTESNDGRQTRQEVRNWDRRALMHRLIGPIAGALPVSMWLLRGSAAHGATVAKAQPADGTPAAFMAEAWRMRGLALDAGDQGYGAVIVKDGGIVGLGPSRVVVNGDPTAHAEIEAIRDAARNLGSRDLGGCVMYGTSRACPMCEAAAYWANIEGLRFGKAIADAGAPRLHHC